MSATCSLNACISIQAVSCAPRFTLRATTFGGARYQGQAGEHGLGHLIARVPGSLQLLLPLSPAPAALQLFLRPRRSRHCSHVRSFLAPPQRCRRHLSLPDLLCLQTARSLPGKARDQPSNGCVPLVWRPRTGLAAEVHARWGWQAAALVD